MSKGFSSEFFLAGRLCKVSHRYNPDQSLLSVQNQEASDLIFLHDLAGFFHVLIFIAPENLFGHDFSYRCVMGIASLRDRSDGDIAIGDGSDESIILTNRQK